MTSKRMRRPATKSVQIRWTIPLGNDAVGEARLAAWKKAALLVMHNDPKLFNAWIREVLDKEARLLLKKNVAQSNT